METNKPTEKSVNEQTLCFAEKKGDKLFIEISITGDPDKAIRQIVKSIQTHEDLFDGAKCEQILFKGRSVDDIRKKAIDKALEEIKNSIFLINFELRNDEIVSDIIKERNELRRLVGLFKENFERYMKGGENESQKIYDEVMLFLINNFEEKFNQTP
jgi:hypothetical protein